MDSFFGADCVTSSLIDRLETYNFLQSCSSNLSCSKKSFTAKPLQVICANIILRSEAEFEKHVKDSPHSIFPFLLKIAIEQNFIQYLKSREYRPIYFGSIYLMIEHWPYQELILGKYLNFMQEQSDFLVSLRSFTQELLIFIQGLIKLIIDIYMPWNNGRKPNRIFNKLNITQLGMKLEEFILNHLTSIVEKYQNSNIEATKGSLELVCDFTINDSTKFPEFLNATWPLLLIKESNLPLTLSFGTITIGTFKFDHNIPESQVISFLDYMLNQKKPPSHLKLRFSPARQEFMEYLREKFSYLKGLALNLYGKRNWLDLSFLSNFNHLRQLDVSETKSKGGWGILSQLPCGLQYLRMNYCRLKQRDFIGLMRHSSTLLQVDLSRNNMAGADVYPALFEFICSLNNVEILALENCCLGQIPQEHFKSFTDNFASSCSKLKVFQLERNYFPTNFFPLILMSIIEKKSLRLLALALPKNVYISDEYEVIDVFSRRLPAIDENGIIYPDRKLARTLEARRKSDGSTFLIEWAKLSNSPMWVHRF